MENHLFHLEVAPAYQHLPWLIWLKLGQDPAPRLLADPLAGRVAVGDVVRGPLGGVYAVFEGRILRWLQQGQKIQAIKFYREETGAGLKESKEAVEALGRQYGLNVGGSGCAGAALVACAILAAIACGVCVPLFG